MLVGEKLDFPVLWLVNGGIDCGFCLGLSSVGGHMGEEDV